MVKIGIIGGSGLDNPNLLRDYEEKNVETKYGSPSSPITCGRMGGVDVCILSRHGKEHKINPHEINYRANIAALASLGCNYIIATSAVGSLREEIKPGDLVFPDQFLDFTKRRIRSFYEGSGEVKHVSMADPFSKYLREKLIETTKELGFNKHDKATIAVIEGPTFGSRAESHMFRKLEADIVGMTTTPECMLAKEAEIPYASIAMSTDYDCWKEDGEPVTYEMVMEIMEKNSEKVKKVLVNSLEKIAISDEDFIKSKIRTVPDFPKPGIMFRDITTLIGDREGFDKTINLFYNRYKNQKIDVVAGIESRGFIFGSALAYKLNVGFVPIRKPGKLPGEIISEKYNLEYGEDKVEIHKDAIKEGENVLICDDLLATGGTLNAACNLVEKVGGRIKECAVVVELPDLKGREKLGNRPIYSITAFEGE